MEFGAILRKMRKGAGYSQEQLAEEIHISRSNISRLETENLELKAADLFGWMNATQSQEMIAALALGIDVGILQQALELISSTSTLVGMILLGGI